MRLYEFQCISFIIGEWGLECGDERRRKEKLLL